MTRSFLAAFAALSVALMVTACGGGGGGGSKQPDGIDRGGRTIARGPITGFGSVWVNGVEYSTTGATITVDDNPGTESDLRVGQFVRVEGTVAASGTTGTATRVTYADDVEGPVQSIDVANGRIVVVGQVVQTGFGTSFDSSIQPNDVSGLAVGDRVEVSGAVNSAGVVEATRVERKTGAGSVEVKGLVSGVDTAARRFSVNAQVVDYGTAMLSGFPSGQPANGDLVEVKGSIGGGSVLVATSVERESSSSPGSVDDKADYEGLITRFVSATDFDVEGQRVTTTASTTYQGGTAANLALDAYVEVEGRFDATGRIVATRIEFEQEADVEINATVDSVNLAGSSFVVLGSTIRTNAQTRFEDQSSASVKYFSLADLRVGDYVEVRAYSSGGGLVATIVERRDAQSRLEVVGTATAVAAPNMTVAGVPVTTDAATEFRDKNGVTVSASAFFAAAAGQTVKVRGTLVGSTLLAERAELED
jgi:hypothetical protein